MRVRLIVRALGIGLLVASVLAPNVASASFEADTSSWSDHHTVRGPRHVGGSSFEADSFEADRGPHGHHRPGPGHGR